MARPLRQHPDFPEGASVRVRPMGRAAVAEKRRLVGRVGQVTRSTLRLIQVEFPGEPYRLHFSPHHLEPVAAAGGDPGGTQ